MTQGKGPAAPGAAPAERGTTVRGLLAEALRRAPATAHQLSREVGLREKDVADHLGHVARSLGARGERLEVEPAACIACGFVFRDRERLTRPGACPRCRSTRIDPPVFRILPQP